MVYKPKPIYLILAILILTPILPLATIVGAQQVFKEEWSLSVEGLVNDVEASLQEKLIVFGTEDPPKIYIVDTSNGGIVWSFEFSYSDKAVETTSLSPNGDYVAAVLYWMEGEKFYFDVECVSIESKEIVWKTPVYEGIGWRIHYTANGDQIIVSSTSNFILELDPRTGEEIASIETPFDATYDYVLAGNSLYAGGFRRDPSSGALSKIDLTNGEVAWINNEPEDSVLALTVDSTGKLVYAGLGIDLGENEYAGKVMAVDTSSGDTIWVSESFSDYVWSIDEFGDKYLVVAVETEGIIVLDKETGKTISRYETPYNTYYVASLNRLGGIVALYYLDEANESKIVFYKISSAPQPTSASTTTVESTQTPTTAKESTTPIESTTSKPVTSKPSSPTGLATVTVTVTDGMMLNPNLLLMIIAVLAVIVLVVVLLAVFAFKK